MKDILNMSIENMTKVSSLLFVISGGLAVSAIVLFFAFNIPRCLRMVSGKHPVHSERKQKLSKIKKAKTEKLSRLEIFDGSEETLPLGRPECLSVEETLLLNDENREQTEVLDAKNMEMIQDIVYMQETENVE